MSKKIFECISQIEAYQVKKTNCRQSKDEIYVFKSTDETTFVLVSQLIRPIIYKS